MSSPIELTDQVPPAAESLGEADDIYLYGKDLRAQPRTAGKQEALIYGFCYQGHCYRLSIPVLFTYGKNGEVGPPVVPPVGDPSVVPRGCGYTDAAGFSMWILEKTKVVTRVERRKGALEELLLDFNLPGRSPATLTYSAKVAIGSKTGKVYE